LRVARVQLSPNTALQCGFCACGSDSSFVTSHRQAIGRPVALKTSLKHEGDWICLTARAQQCPASAALTAREHLVVGHLSRPARRAGGARAQPPHARPASSFKHGSKHCSACMHIHFLMRLRPVLWHLAALACNTTTLKAVCCCDAAAGNVGTTSRPFTTIDE
jgi:hypothetical protein